MPQQLIHRFPTGRATLGTDSQSADLEMRTLRLHRATAANAAAWLTLATIAVTLDNARAEAAPVENGKTKVSKRRALERAVNRNPRIATRKWFLKRAALFGVDLPITIRLTPVVNQSGTPLVPLGDDSIKFALGTDPTEPPVPAGTAPGDVLSTVTGSVKGSLRFSQDAAGYGRLGAVELGFDSIDMSGTGFDLALAGDPTPCAGDPALARTSATVDIGAAAGSQGYVDLFGGTFDIDLHLSLAFASQIRPDCASSFQPTSVMDGIGRPPLPLRVAGAFRLSPAMTADGRVRLGKLAMSGPQKDSFVQVHTCTDAPPVAGSCTPSADGILKGRLSATQFTAEMLVGRVA
jgi:hypothetical protein